MTRYQREALANMIGYAMLALFGTQMMIASVHTWSAVPCGAWMLFSAWRFEKARATFIGDESP